ncbi:3'-5' exonuclease [Lamprobacter modestohalophilus]|uniref:3'-5' exonuclease n=1 Tax=Lamprobacter modestohalophilus TaxID=1064514 RepID=UPI002ADED6BC|nr:3'-5' exonuclease [Lamprobacter modestohalophilus]MEA1053424.1 3'-5' exonuclease [Lamprobacter modestohalophilus]
MDIKGDDKRMRPTLYLALETTGADPQRDEVLEIGVLDQEGRVLLDSLVCPVQHRHWIGAQAIHGIRPADVQDAPWLDDLRPRLIELLTDADVVVIDAAFERDFLRVELEQAAAVHGAMDAFAEIHGTPSTPQGGYCRKPLQIAAAHVGFAWPGITHRTIHNAQAIRAIWHWLQQQDSHRASSAMADTPVLSPPLQDT